MKHRLIRTIKSPWFRLASTYLLIIMIMSIGFSVVFYNTSWHELGRQLPGGPVGMNHGLLPDDLTHYHVTTGGMNGSAPTVDRFLQQRVDEGRQELLTRLIIVNVVALVGGSLVSYYLARRTLRPIEDAMEAQSQFVSDASHELRTPLTAIQAGNEVALRDKKLNLDKAKQVIAANSEEAAKLQALSNGLLNLAKQTKTTLTLREVSLQTSVSQAMTQVVAAAQARSIAIDDQTANINLLAEEQALVQTLVILLDNAIKYSPPNTTITLTSTQRGKSAQLKVRDEGIGIRASDLPHIFRRFYRADTVRGGGDQHGYGLGLSIAHKLVQQMHGTISVESELGKGTTFSLRLPLAKY